MPKKAQTTGELPTIQPPTVAEVLEWLTTAPAIVGQCGVDSDCMLVRFLKDRYPTLSFSVSYSILQHLVKIQYWQGKEPLGLGRDPILEVRDERLVAALYRFDCLSYRGFPVSREAARACFV